jgi:hypothetical protein
MPEGLTLRIILELPPKGVAFAIQKGRGSTYETIQQQTSIGHDLRFEFTVEVRVTGDQTGPDFAGPLVQGTKGERFVYVDIGTYAGQTDSCWSRRMKLPLHGITAAMIESGAVLEARIPAMAKDGGPSCGTIKPNRFTGGGWKPV